MGEDNRKKNISEGGEPGMYGGNGRLNMSEVREGLSPNGANGSLMVSAYSPELNTSEGAKSFNVLDKSGVTEESIEEFRAWLRAEDRSPGTIDKYVRDIRRLAAWMNGREPGREPGDARIDNKATGSLCEVQGERPSTRELTKDVLTEWKAHLVASGYEPTTVNSMLAVANSYCRFAGLDIRVRFLRIQRRLFCDENRELSKDDYVHLITTAVELGKTRLALIMETIGATGIRVSELEYITVEAAKAGRSTVSLKGKIRVILLPDRLCRKLLQFARVNEIDAGPVFITSNGSPISRKQVWAEMKDLCNSAGVEDSKVYPHNLRHLFARVYYDFTHDVAQLADILGHSSIETTRIYLLSTGAEHARKLEQLQMVI